MQELNMVEVDEVGGGGPVAFVVGAATVGAAVAVGGALCAFAAGYAVGTVIYKTYEWFSN